MIKAVKRIVGAGILCAAMAGAGSVTLPQLEISHASGALAGVSNIEYDLGPAHDEVYGVSFAFHGDADQMSAQLTPGAEWFPCESESIGLWTCATPGLTSQDVTRLSVRAEV